jgi:hypothetical protein
MTAIIAPQTITLTIPGTLATSSVVTMRMPFKGVINDATIALTGAPAGSALTAGLVVGANTAATFSVAAAGVSADATLGTLTNRSFAKGALVSLDILTVGSGTAGTGATATFTVSEVSDATHIQADGVND